MHCQNQTPATSSKSTRPTAMCEGDAFGDLHRIGRRIGSLGWFLEPRRRGSTVGDMGWRPHAEGPLASPRAKSSIGFEKTQVESSALKAPWCH
jgi:hypothetical protein